MTLAADMPLTRVSGQAPERRSIRTVPTWLLMLPALLYIGVVFLWPLANTAWTAVSDPTPGWQNFALVFSEVAYRRIYLNTFLISFVVAIVCALMAFPLALYIARQRGLIGATLLAVSGLSFWISFLVRTYAWTVLLGNRGPIATLAKWLGLDVPVILFTTLASVIGMTHILLPFMVMSIYVVLAKIDPNLIRAASGLGASRGQTFRSIILPLAMPGVISGGLLVFIFCLGFYVTPALIGSPRDLFVSGMIADEMEQLLEFGVASAMAMVLLGITLLMLVAYDRIAGLDRILG